MQKYIKLTNGAILPMDKILLVARKDIGQYMVFIEGLQGASVNADLADVELIEKALDTNLIVGERPPEVPKSKLEIAD